MARYGRVMLMFAASAAAVSPEGNQTLLAVGVGVALVAAWLGLSALVRLLRARRAAVATGGRFADFVLEALVNAAKIDGRVNEAERAAIAQAFADATGTEIDPPTLSNAFANARLSKAELLAYLAAGAGNFSQQEKMSLLKALMAVFVADGRFDETEHAALIDYTAAVGFDRSSAAQMLRSVAGDVRRGNII